MLMNARTTDILYIAGRLRSGRGERMMLVMTIKKPLVRHHGSRIRAVMMMGRDEMIAGPLARHLNFARRGGIALGAGGAHKMQMMIGDDKDMIRISNGLLAAQAPARKGTGGSDKRLAHDIVRSQVGLSASGMFSRVVGFAIGSHTLLWNILLRALVLRCGLGRLAPQPLGCFMLHLLEI